MNIKQKIKSAVTKLKKNARALKNDVELAADEVISAEVFPEKKCAKRKNSGVKAKKPASKRTRPTNDNYQMIDPSDGTADSSKS